MKIISIITKINRNLINLFFTKVRVLYKTQQQRMEFQNAKNLVHPFSGYLLSDMYLSEEIDFYKLRWLNPKAKRLNRWNLQWIKKPVVIYCQVDQLVQFVRLLPDINAKFVLITGKWHLPGLTKSEEVDAILESTNLISWYSQNQIFEELPIKPFPYGIRYENLGLFCEYSEPTEKRKSEVLIPFATIHEHMPPEARAHREQLIEKMSPKKSLAEYKNDLKSHSFVFCTPGDRPDTYRIWESLVCGATPVCLNEKVFIELLGNCAVYVDDFSNKSLSITNTKPNKNVLHIHKLAHWENEISSDFI